MSWRESCAMDERVRFIVDQLTGLWTMTELCERYEVSRKTGYKWLDRYRSEGASGLMERSRAAKVHGRATPQNIVDAIVGLRRERPTWGPRKIVSKLEARQADVEWPSASTAGEILKRAGLVCGHRVRRRAPPRLGQLTEPQHANHVWGLDHKGWIRLGDGSRLEPFTVTDGFSRYLIRLAATGSTQYAECKPPLERAFCEYGLPEVIRSDNGPPFASTAAGGLGWLSVQLIKAGVKPERIKPANPQQNGCHERMHRTLKEDTANPPAANRRAQQRRFDDFRRVFNEERPHEALGLDTPAKHYQPSPRIYSGRLREPDYAADFEVRRVRSNGEIKWRGNCIFLSEALIGEPVGIVETEESSLHTIHYGPVLLGYLDRGGTFRQSLHNQSRKTKAFRKNV